MAKTMCTWRDVTVILTVLTATVVAAGAIYQDRERIAQNADAITALRIQHEECERIAAARWEKVADTLGAVQVRGARSEEKLDAVLREMRLLHGVETKDK